MVDAAKPLVYATLAFDPTDMARRGRIGAFVTHSRHDPRETTRNARAAFLAKFARKVDPEGILPEEERQRRAEMARRAHYSRIARLSALTRSRKTKNAAAGLGPAAA